MVSDKEKELFNRVLDKRPTCKECFCNDLCIFLLSKTGRATTSCADFKERVGRVVKREMDKSEERNNEFRELKEKATAKRPAYQGEHEKCPICGSFCIGEYCMKCGQKILCD